MGGDGPATVLVVDDDPSLRLLCRVNLELEGYRVLEAGDLESATHALDDGVDAVLVDLHLGSQDGLELLPVLRDRGAAFALLTGSPGADLPHGEMVIGKPFSIDQLTTTVRQLVDR